MASVTKTVKVPRSVAARLARTARVRGCPESELIRRGIELVVDGDVGLDMQALIGPDIGIGRGPRDLSRNRRRLVGYGRSSHR